MIINGISVVHTANDLEVTTGSKLSSRSSDYVVQDSLGHGAFAKVVKCEKSATKEKVAVRIEKIRSLYEAKEKDQVLHKLSSLDPDVWNLVRWHGSFIHNKHLCQEFELLDITLRQFVQMRPTRSLDLDELRTVLYQLATALEGLNSLGLVHTDLKYNNIMLVDHVKQPLRVKLVDFGSASRPSKKVQGEDIQCLWNRSPEMILGLPCSPAIDIWSLGCIAVRLFEGRPLYPGASEYQMLQMMVKTQGPVPSNVLNNGIKTSQFYRRTSENTWELKDPHEFGSIPERKCGIDSMDDLQTINQGPDSHLSTAELMAKRADLENFAALIKQMLELDPAKRITPSQIRDHPFMKKNDPKDFGCLMSSIRDQGDSRSDYVTQQSFHRDCKSPGLSCGAPSQVELMSVPEVGKPSPVLTEPLGTRKRARDELMQGHLDSRSPVRRKRKTCGLESSRSSRVDTMSGHVKKQTVDKSVLKEAPGSPYRAPSLDQSMSVPPKQEDNPVPIKRLTRKRSYNEISQKSCGEMPKSGVENPNKTLVPKRRRRAVTTGAEDIPSPSRGPLPAAVEEEKNKTSSESSRDDSSPDRSLGGKTRRM